MASELELATSVEKSDLVGDQTAKTIVRPDMSAKMSPENPPLTVVDNYYMGRGVQQKRMFQIVEYRDGTAEEILVRYFCLRDQSKANLLRDTKVEIVRKESDAIAREEAATASPIEEIIKP